MNSTVEKILVLLLTNQLHPDLQTDRSDDSAECAGESG